MDKKGRLRAIIFTVLFVGLLAGVTLLLFPYFSKLSEPQYQAQIQEYINGMGFFGILTVLGIQVLQIVIAFIPGETVELVAGALYGTFGGLAICLVGCIAASSVIFILSKKFGKRIINLFFKEETMKRWHWLENSKKAHLVTFILFIIPGTPKDLMTYIIGITEMKLSQFILISTIARIPSVITSTMIGSSVRQGQWVMSIIAFIITGVFGVFGILFKDKAIDFCREKIKRSSSNSKNKFLKKSLDKRKFD